MKQFPNAQPGRLTCRALLIALATSSALASGPTQTYEALYEAVMVRNTAAFAKQVDAEEAIHPTRPLGDRYGGNGVAPLIWPDSRYLLEGESGDHFATALDAFAALSSEEIHALSIERRAMLQRHLWVLFDWSCGLTADPDSELPAAERDELFRLQEKLARSMRRLALSEPQIAELPDPITATVEAGQHPATFDRDSPFTPFFPRDLRDPEGPWLCLGKTNHALTINSHTDLVNARSVFHLYARLPGDRAATQAYFETLGNFHQQWITEKPEPAMLSRTLPHGGIHNVEIYINPDTPQFPAGTQFCLVEQALLIDDRGQLVASPLIIGVQLRAYLEVALDAHLRTLQQAVAEWLVQPRRLIDGDATLEPVGEDELHFRTLGLAYEPFEHPENNRHRQAPRLRTCMACHDGWGIHSVNTRAQLFEPRSLLPPRFLEIPPDRNAGATIRAKRQSHSWGMLQALWRAGD